jgi:hypothetical protein
MVDVLELLQDASAICVVAYIRGRWLDDCHSLYLSDLVRMELPKNIRQGLAWRPRQINEGVEVTKA